ncbi:MAG: hypothetical protein V3V33_15935 [Candidatus Lokiarchaeia archaeon]
MLNKNEIDISNNPVQIENKNKYSIEYKIPFPEPLARGFERFVEKFNTSYENLFNYLLNDHFKNLLYEIKEDNNELLIFYYFCTDAIFSENKNSDYNSPNKTEMKTQNITVKITEEHNTAVKEICKVIYYKPKKFINKAIKCQWERIKSDIDAGWYNIINNFCDLPRIKHSLEKVMKESKKNKVRSKNE